MSTLVVNFKLNLRKEGKELQYQCKVSLERVESGEENEPTIIKIRREMSAQCGFQGQQKVNRIMMKSVVDFERNLHREAEE